MADLKTLWGDHKDYSWFTEAKFKSLTKDDAHYKIAETVYRTYKNMGAKYALSYLTSLTDTPRYMEEFLKSALDPISFCKYANDNTTESILLALGAGYYGYRLGNVCHKFLSIEGINWVIDGRSNSWVYNYVTFNIRSRFEQLTGIDAYVAMDDEFIILQTKDEEQIMIDSGLGVFATEGIDNDISVSAVEAYLEVMWSDVLDRPLYTRRQEVANHARTKAEVRKFLEVRHVKEFTKRVAVLEDGKEVKLSTIKFDDLGTDEMGQYNRTFKVLMPYVKTDPPIRDAMTCRALLFLRVFGQELK